MAPGRGAGPVGALGAVIALVCSAFLLIPGSLSDKAQFVLHGVCAQRPSHSLQFAGLALPLDARMTGLYTGAAVAAYWLAIRGRPLAWVGMSRVVVVMLSAFVALLVVDGANALLFDLNLPHPYSPSNTLRLISGILAGTSLGAAVAYLFSVSTWERSHHARRSQVRPAEIGPPLAIAAAIGLIASSGFPPVIAPLTIWLLLATVAVFSAVSMLVLALVGDRAGTYRSWSDLAPLAAGSLMVATSVIIAMAGLRLFLERTLALPSLT